MKDQVTTICSICGESSTKQFSYVVKCCRNRNGRYTCRTCSNRLIQSNPSTQKKSRESKKLKGSDLRYDQDERSAIFIKRSRAVHGDRYDYSLVEYKRIDENVLIICNSHGAFSQKPDSHQRGSGCPKCARESGNKKQSELKSSNLISFAQVAKTTHDDLYDYSEASYVNAKTKVKIICPDHGEFYQTPNKHIHGSNPTGCPSCPNTISREHQKIIDFLDTNHKINHETNNRIVLDGLELDIWIPEFNLGIEINGCYWHGCRRNNLSLHQQIRYKHVRKAEAAKAAEITLLQFWDNEINNKFRQVKKVMDAHLGAVKSIYARKCIVVTPTESEARLFFDNNHLQGHRPAKLYYALALDDKILSMISLSGHSKHDWELIRFASSDCRVVGGFSKLLKTFVRAVDPDNLMTFADRRISKGNVYHKSGFKKIEDTKPNYFYFKNGIVMSRQKCQKRKLSRILGENFNSNFTEKENMLLNGWTQVHDAGHSKFVKTF